MRGRATGSAAAISPGFAALAVACARAVSREFPTAAHTVAFAVAIALVTASAAGSTPIRLAAVDAVQDGERLASQLGCGGCHAGVAGAGLRELAPRFGDGSPALASEFVFAYLENPTVRRPELAPARMPDFGLSEPERLALARYLAGDAGDGAAVTAAATRHPDATAALGARLFRDLRCAACHAGTDTPSAPPAPDLSRVGDRLDPQWVRGWLRAPGPVRPVGHGAAETGTMPDFRLSAGEADDLAAYLASRVSGVATGWTTQALTPAREERARRLLDGRFSCMGCHRIEGAGGTLGPSLEGVRERLLPSAVRRMISDPAAEVPESLMPRQPMRDADADLLTSFLLSRPGSWAPAESPAGAPGPGSSRILRSGASSGTGSGGEPGSDTGEGEALYAEHCSSCHGTGGAGDGWNAAGLPVPPTVHADSATMAARADDTLFDGIYGGGWVLGKSARMPAFGELLSADEIRAVVGYIRVLCGCEGPGWSRGGGIDR